MAGQIKSSDTKIFSEAFPADAESLVLNSIKDPFGIIDIDFKVRWANRQMAGIFLYQPDEIIGKICFKMFWGVDGPCPDCPLKKAIHTGRSQVEERWIDFVPNQRQWGEVRYHPILSGSGKVVAVAFLIIDITEKRKKAARQKQYRQFLSKKLNQAAGNRHQITLNRGEISIEVQLSARETQVLGLMAEGCTNNEISSLLEISPNTVKSHVNNIFNKLGVSDRTQACVIGTRFGLIS